MAFSSIFVPQVYASSETKTNIANSLPLEDLETDPTFNKSQYIAGVGVDLDVQFVRFQEYGYSYQKKNTKDFGLYIYLFANMKDMILSSSQNEATISIKNDVNGVSIDYSDYRLALISTDGNFYKFKVIDDNNYIFNSLNDEARTYTIAGIDLRIKDDGEYKYNAKAFGIGGKWTFTGYAKGYGENILADSTLTCKSATDFYTLPLKVRHTNFLTSSDKGANYRNNINSVYFSIPDSILKEYGKIQKIKAEWYEYKTTPIIFTSDDTGEYGTDPNYDEFKDYIGVEISEENAIERAFYEGMYSTTHYTGFTYNISKYGPYLPNNNQLGIIFPHDCGYDIKMLTWLFPVYSLSGIPRIKYQYDQNESRITGEFLQEYALNFYKNHGVQLSQDKYLKSRKIAEGLFQYEVDEGRIMGHNVKQFDIGETFDVRDYDSTHKNWQKFFDFFGKKQIKTDDGLEDVKPILEVKELTNANDLLINTNDYQDFQKAFNEAKDKEEPETMYLFRFAQTDYLTNKLTCIKEGPLGGTGALNRSENMAYNVQTAFLDFDILELTLNKDGVMTVFACVSTPKDIFSDIELPGCQDMSAYTNVILFLGAVIIVYRIFDKNFRRR